MRRTYFYSMLASAFLSTGFIFAAKLVFVNEYDKPVKVRLKGWKVAKYKKTILGEIPAGYEQEKSRLVDTRMSVEWEPTLKSEIKQNVLDVYHTNDLLFYSINLEGKTKKELEIEEEAQKDNKEVSKKELEKARKKGSKVTVPSGYTRTIIFEEKSLFQDTFQKGGKSVSAVFKIGKDLFEKTRENALDIFHGAFGPARKILRNKKGTAVYDIIHKNPYAKKEAKMRTGGPITSTGEKKAFDARQNKVKEAQAKFLGYTFTPNEKPLVLAFVASGGGQRARLCTLGSSLGAEKTGLLDCATYFSTLSGSTWFLAPWLYMDIKKGISLEEMKKRAINDAKSNLGPKDIKKDVKDVISSLEAKFAFGGSINIIDLYGDLLGIYYFNGYGDDKNPQRTYLSDIASKIETGNYVIPVFTAVTAEIGMAHEWCFFTPWEFGSRWFGAKGAYIPVWSFGRKFENEKSKNWGSAKKPLYGSRSTLPFLMAIWGSAMAATAGQAYDRFIGEMLSGPIKTIVRYAMKQTDLKKMRLFWGEVFNFMYKLPKFKYSKYKYLKLADAGVKLLCPIFDTYRRPADKNIKDGSAPDVIVIFDVSAKVGEKELKSQVEYANKHGLPFPKIDYAKLGKDFISVFTKNPDKAKFADYEVPTVIYMHWITDKTILNKFKKDPVLGDLAKSLQGFDPRKCLEGSCGTFNFQHAGKVGGLYTSEYLINLPEFNLRASIDKIKNVMKERLKLNRKRDEMKN